ncbi:phytoene desaturase family protein [Treponema sp. R6D11]
MIKKYDYIIIGAGIGGLSVAGFLSKYNKKVLILEKHDKVGGLCTSFKRNGTQFDCGIEGLHELEPNETIPQFITFLGGKIESKIREENICCYINNKKYKFRHNHIKEDFILHFSDNKDDIEKLFAVSNGIMEQALTDNKAPVPPYDMSIIELLKFGIHNMIKKPLLMKYGLRNFNKVIWELTSNKEIAEIIYSKAMADIVYFGYAYRWWAMDKTYYPIGGMQKIADTMKQIAMDNGCEILLNTTVNEIIIDKKTQGIKTKNGDIYYADKIISNASPIFTNSIISSKIKSKVKMDKIYKKKDIFQSACILFLTVKDIDYLGGNNYIYISSDDCLKIPEKTYNPNNVPIVIQVLNKKPDDKFYPITALAPIPYEYNNCWNTFGTKEKSEDYYKLKNEVKNILLNRICEKLGDEFKNSITYAELGTPLTFERYTNNTNGSFMGFAINQKNYGKFLKQKTEIPGLYLVGQWTFPGFGVAGVMASGYYLAKELLKEGSIDLEREYIEYFR